MKHNGNIGSVLCRSAHAGDRWPAVMQPRGAANGGENALVKAGIEALYAVTVENRPTLARTVQHDCRG